MNTSIVQAGRRLPAGEPLKEFEPVYRDNVDALIAYFGRRCAEPADVADLTSETMLQAAGSFGTFDPGRGTARGWLFGIAAHVYAQHCARQAGGREMTRRLAGRRPLQDHQYEELAARIDAEEPGRRLLEQCAALRDGERQAIELVDLIGLTPKEAARALGVPGTVLRRRLSRARARLRAQR